MATTVWTGRKTTVAIRSRSLRKRAAGSRRRGRSYISLPAASALCWPTSYDWLTPISQLAAAQKWAANDLFVTTYNMKALGNSPQQQKLIVTQPERTLGETMSQVEASMTNGFLKSPSTK